MSISDQILQGPVWQLWASVKLAKCCPGSPAAPVHQGWNYSQVASTSLCQRGDKVELGLGHKRGALGSQQATICYRSKINSYYNLHVNSLYVLLVVVFVFFFKSVNAWGPFPPNQKEEVWQTPGINTQTTIQQC